MSQSNYKGTVGYVGLGDMGGGITTHLAEVGVKLVVFDLNQAAVDAMVAKGARAAQSLQDVATSADVIIICVDPEAQVQKVFDGLLPHMRAGQTVIIQSSVPPHWLAEMAERAAAVGAKLFDSPVSGSHDDRLKGTLSVLVGASEESVGDVADLLSSIGRPLYLDALGAGEVAKLANNAIMMITHEAVSEAMVYARAWGMTEENVIKAVKISSGACFVIDNWAYFDVQVRNGMTGRLGPKQMEHILETAKQKGVHLSMLEAGHKVYKKIDDARYEYITGHKKEDS